MKTKRLVALALALTMVFCFMAMSASAATTEIQPRGTCPKCINGYVTSRIQVVGSINDYPPYLTGYGECGKMTMPHLHRDVHYEVWVDCSLCSYNGVSYSYWRVDCIYE